MAIVYWNLSMTWNSDLVNPVALVWASDHDEDELTEMLIKKYKEEVSEGLFFW